MKHPTFILQPPKKMSCNYFPYLRGGCSEVPPVSSHNFSSYSNDASVEYNLSSYSTDLPSAYNSSVNRTSYSPIYASVGDDGMAELLGISGDILKKVDEIELMMISTSIDQRILMGDFIKETCPALEQINYTCPTVLCPTGMTYTVEFDYNYAPAYFVVFVYFLWRMVRDTKPVY